MRALMSVAAAVLLSGLGAPVSAQTGAADAVLPPALEVLSPDQALPDVPSIPGPVGAGLPGQAGAPGAAPEEKFTPAVLTLERKVQLPTACQYWIKLENRLPFKIRNMALYFEAYIWQPGYDHPVLFDSATRSFAELRPTDSQYRDLFFQSIECDRLAYVRVEDAGHCAMGALTKFSAQKGDCARYLEIRDSELACIYLDRSILAAAPAPEEAPAPAAAADTDLISPEDAIAQAEGAQPAAAPPAPAPAPTLALSQLAPPPPPNPCTTLSQADIDGFMASFAQRYEAGDPEQFKGLFAPEARGGAPAQGQGADRVVEELGLDSPAKRRALKVQDLTWQPTGGGYALLQVKGELETERDQWFASTSHDRLQARLKLHKRDGVMEISSIDLKEP